MPQKRVLRSILVSKEEEVTTSWRNYLRGLHNLLPSLNIMRMTTQN
jgi:hypothetical protein